ncbi:FIST N-terminal domain-containing protein [Fuchsiella alkaliacetigena]|uniref:FIST N-terminal domain-containing protein n=1 Tax=Fuchsiella alkaliacetigena TaxID=957042 RepID=UPI00200AC6A8|nr:FIST N-terminal domain-containing protein [Fuchsiella alkaliacetigena]MCK8824032.1 FIST C-terminal domain-containing protein [Fuchsiella alkaliacetigena]
MKTEEGKDLQLDIRLGSSFAQDSIRAVREVAAQIRQADPNAVVIFFCSSRYDHNLIAEAMREEFSEQTVIGCTSAGELVGEAGYKEGGLVGASLLSPHLIAHPHLMDNLSDYVADRARNLADQLCEQLLLADAYDPKRQFGLLLIDGISLREEVVAASLYNCLEGVPIFGGSAADELNFEETLVYYDGEFHSDSAVFTLFECDLPFQVFRFQHFEPTDKRLVITEADPATRIVFEINGLPAAEAFAEAIEVPIEEFDADVFAANPLMLRVGGEWYVRAVQSANPDGSLSFWCAIDKGLVLTVGQGQDLVKNIANSMDTLRSTFSDLRFVLGCDCLFRRLELLQKNRLNDASTLFKGMPYLGFSTYGEQYNGLHINQTLTGVVIGGNSK